MLRLHIELDEQTVRDLILKHLQFTTGLNIKMDDVRIEVKSKQNYKAEWEKAEFRGVLDMTQD